MGTEELSTNARIAEDALRAIFKRGERWNAALLLEEADLFLAKRTSEEFERNALVNVFLRHLEYYQGLLLMTSNRAEEFDPAFNSRIHLYVQYQEPDAAIRTQIWRHFIPKDWARTWRSTAEISKISCELLFSSAKAPNNLSQRT